jgi:hypothetical protein
LGDARRVFDQGALPDIGAFGLVVERDGEEVGALFAGEGDAPALVLGAAGETGMLMLQVSRYGAPELQLIDERGTARLKVCVTGIGNECPDLTLYDATAVARVDVSVDPSGLPTVRLNDKLGAIRAALMVTKSGKPRIGVGGR